MSAYRYIAIEGVIGVGKTTLSKLLAKELNARLILEEFVSNTFLEKFYENPERYAFPTEIGFLVERYQQFESEFTESLFNEPIVADYFIDKSRIFARLNLNDAHFQLYKKLYAALAKNLRDPDILIYLINSTEGLQENIRNRARNMEKDIPDEYLIKLQQAYHQYFRQELSFPILQIDVSEIDFLESKEPVIQVKNLLDQHWNPGLHHVTL